MSRGGDSQDALRRVWMEGYEAGKRAAERPITRCGLCSKPMPCVTHYPDPIPLHPDACEHGVRLKHHCRACVAMIPGGR